MTKVGLITVGQAPRSDVVPDMAAILGGDVEIIEAGALDGLTREQATTRSSSPAWPMARRSSSGRAR
jgi:protein AroM